jgi:hypothetical protein
MAPKAVEESVACEKLIIKSNANCFPELYALSQRLAVLYDGNNIKDYEIVGGPYQLVHAWRLALRPLAVDLEVKIILYALFDRVLMVEMPSVYRRMNQALKTDGILPYLKPVSVNRAREREIRQRAAQEGRRTVGGAGEQSREERGDELFENVLELMSGCRGSAGRPGAEVRLEERLVGRVEQALADEGQQVLDTPDPNTPTAPDADLTTDTMQRRMTDVARARYLRAIVDDGDAADLDDEERAMIERLRKTKLGTWFELKGEGGEPKRVKLSWMSLLTSTCMFVDGAGMQAGVKTVRELARELLSGQARVFPRQQHPFIERALVSIRKALGQDETGDRALR